MRVQILNRTSLYCVLYFSGSSNTCKQITSPSSLRDVEWATHNCTLGFNVCGMFTLNSFRSIINIKVTVARKRSCGKVMFLFHLSHSVQGGMMSLPVWSRVPSRGYGPRGGGVMVPERGILSIQWRPPKRAVRILLECILVKC